jgi:hypothetical protein
VAVLVVLGVLVGVLSVLNLLLTFGVIRRLREHGQLIADAGIGDGGRGAPTLPVGQRVAEFSGTTTDGIPVSRDLLSGHTLVAFLMTGCEPCQRRLPELVETARAWPGGRDDTLVVVVGEGDAAAEYVDQVAPVTRVVLEPRGSGEITAALSVQGYPQFGVVDSSGTVVQSSFEPAEMRLPIA